MYNYTKVLKIVACYSCLYQITGDVKHRNMYNYKRDVYCARKRISTADVDIETMLINKELTDNIDVAQMIVDFVKNNHVSYFGTKIGTDLDRHLVMMTNEN